LEKEFREENVLGISL